MKNSRILLADLKESNMNLLVDSEMFMVRGGGKCGKKSSKKSKKSKKSSKKKSYGCGCSCKW